MRSARRLHLVAHMAALALPGRTLAGAQAPMPDSVPGSDLTVYLMTMGQGDLVWERFGHNAIGIRDHRTGRDIVYNWGIFSFDQPGFLARFLRGDMMYWMAPALAQPTIAEYIALNRSVVLQELNLSPAQRIALRDFVHWNALEENKYYRYHYFLDNCSTRVRDALDRVLGGAIRQATQHVLTDQSFRDHALRLMAGDLLTLTGIDIGLGRPADRKISAWEEMFIPMRLRDRLREITVPDETGRAVPLVTAERTVFEATRPPERERPPARGIPSLAVGLVVAAALLGFARRGAARSVALRRTAFALALAWATVVGFVGVLLVLLRVATRHDFAWHNTNLLLYNPLWLVLAAAAAVALARPRAGRAAELFAKIVAGLSIAGVLLMILPMVRQDSLAVLLLTLPVNLAAAVVLRDAVRPAAVTAPA